MSSTEDYYKKFDRPQGVALIVGLIGVLLAIAGGIVMAMYAEDRARLFQPFLIAYVMVFSLGIGCLATLMVHHQCGGGWSLLIQRMCEAGAKTLPHLFVLGLIIVVGGAWFGSLYPWTDAEYLAHHEIVQKKSQFLNLGAFTVAYFIYFAIWIALSFLYTRWSKRLDVELDDAILSRMKRLAGPGLVLFVLTITLAATHWMMSLEAVWFSTIYGAWLIGSIALATMAFCAIMLSYVADAPGIRERLQTKHYHHLGNFMLGFTIFWSYTAFSQYLLIWNANLYEEIPFYLHRQGGQLVLMTVFLIVGGWFAPMWFLLMRPYKKNPVILRRIAYWILFMRVIDMYWNIAPSYEDHYNTINWITVLLSFAAVAGLGGFWLWFFLRQYRKLPPVPVHDPRNDLMFKHDEAHSHA